GPTVYVFVGDIMLRGIGRLPLVKPAAGFDPGEDGIVAFDRAVCASGLTDYVRPADPTDLPADLQAAEAAGVVLFGVPEYVLVCQQAPGVRFRLELAADAIDWQPGATCEAVPAPSAN